MKHKITTSILLIITFTSQQVVWAWPDFNTIEHALRPLSSQERSVVAADARSIQRWVIGGHNYYFAEVREDTPFGLYISSEVLKPVQGDRGEPLYLGFSPRRYVSLYEYIINLVQRFSEGDESLLWESLEDMTVAAFILQRFNIKQVYEAGRQGLLEQMVSELDKLILVGGQFYNAAESALIQTGGVAGKFLEDQRRRLTGFLWQLLMERKVMREAKEMLDLYRGRWKTPYVREHFLPRQLMLFLNHQSLTQLSAGGVDITADTNRVGEYFQLLRQKGWNVPVTMIPRSVTFYKWCKDTRLLLPHRKGLPYRYLTVEPTPPLRIDYEHALDPKLFWLGFELEDLSCEGAAVVGWAKTPFIIFADSVPKEEVDQLEKLLRQIPSYEDIHLYRFPAGWATLKLSYEEDGQQREKTFLVDGAHLDGVATFFPAEARKDNMPALLLDPWYYKELVEQNNSAFREFIKDQGVENQDLEIVLIEEDETYYFANPGRPTPERNLFVFNACDSGKCQTLNRLKLKDDHYLVLDRDHRPQYLAIAGAGIDCLMMPVELVAGDIMPFTRMRDIIAVAEVIEKNFMEALGSDTFDAEILEAIDTGLLIDRFEDYIYLELARLRLERKFSPQAVKTQIKKIIAQDIGEPLRSRATEALAQYFIKDGIYYLALEIINDLIIGSRWKPVLDKEKIVEAALELARLCVEGGFSEEAVRAQVESFVHADATDHIRVVDEITGHLLQNFSPSRSSNLLDNVPIGPSGATLKTTTLQASAVEELEGSILRPRAFGEEEEDRGHATFYKVNLIRFGMDNLRWEARSDRGTYQYLIRRMNREDINSAEIDEMLESLYPDEWNEAKRRLTEKIGDLDAFLLHNEKTNEVAGMYVYVPPKEKRSPFTGNLWILAVRSKYRATGAVDVLLLHLKNILFECNRKFSSFYIGGIIGRKSRTAKSRQGIFLVSKNRNEDDTEFTDRAIALLKKALDIRSVITLEEGREQDSLFGVPFLIDVSQRAMFEIESSI